MILAILLALAAWLLSFILPWWSLAIPASLLGIWRGKTGWSSFGYGFLGIAGLWLVQAVYIHYTNEGILTTRIAELFSLPQPALVIAATIGVGGIAGGLSTLTGYFIKKVFFNRNP